MGYNMDMKTLVYGSLNIDITYFVSHIVTPGETLSSNSRAIRAGGKGANQAAALALAGSVCYLAGKIAQKDYWILDLLNKYGVNTDFVLKSGDATGEAIIQIANNGQNSIILSPGANRELHRIEIDAVLEHFEPGDLLVLQNETNHVNSLILAAKNKGMKVAFNPSPIADNIYSLPLSLVDIFFVNEIEASALASYKGDLKTTLNKLSALYPNAEIIMTAGSKGSYYKYKETEAYCGINPVKVVDTTGAGDTFTGYFLTSRYVYNYSVEDSLALASKASSIAISRIGSMEAIPKSNEVFHSHEERPLQEDH